MPPRWQHTHRRPVDPRRHAVRGDDGEERHRRDVGRGRRRLAVLKAMPNHRVELHSPKTPVPVLWWRSVGHTHTAFVDGERDRRAGARRRARTRSRTAARCCTEHPRHLGVLELAAEKAGWGKPLPAGRARGLAVHESFGSVVAQVAEVSVDGRRDPRPSRRLRGRLRPRRSIPTAVEAQMEGASPSACRRRSTARSRSRTGASSSRTSTTTRCCA